MHVFFIIIYSAQRDEMLKRREQEREEMIQQRKREAEEQKRKMLAMYDEMSKAPPKTRDLVEEAIQQRHREAEEHKKKLLAAYDAAARSGHPGPKTADFNAINDSTSGRSLQ